MTDKQRKDLEKLTKDLKRFDDVNKKWIQYTKAYQVIAFIVAFICLVMTILFLKGV